MNFHHKRGELRNQYRDLSSLNSDQMAIDSQVQVAKPWNGVKSIRDDISRNCHVNVDDSLGSIRTLTVTPCVEVVAVWTVPGAVSSGCILAEPRKGDKLTPGGNEVGLIWSE